MNRYEHLDLLAERDTLQRLLADIPEEDVLDRGSFQARLDDVESRLAGAVADMREPARARLTFRGRPVVGDYGVRADFGAEATGEFIKAVTAIAASLTRPLGQFGPLPNRVQNQLLITGTVPGSFGFQLEEHLELQSDQLPLELGYDTAISQALAQSQALLESTKGTDDDLTDAIAEVDPRARGAVRAFLEKVAANDASFALTVGQTRTDFRDVGQVRRSLERLGQDNLHESNLVVHGAFQGFLPQNRTFEFRRTETDEILTGRVSASILDPSVINRYLGQPVEITLTVVRVGNGRPRYVLNDLPTWTDANA